MTPSSINVEFASSSSIERTTSPEQYMFIHETKPSSTSVEFASASTSQKTTNPEQVSTSEMAPSSANVGQAKISYYNVPLENR